MNKVQKFDIPVHPLAALFPMMPEDELQALANDIKENGLIEPIRTDETGMLIDGRNRLKACQIANVEPTFKSYDGDAVAFIWSVNDRRRHMNKGQRAMVAAMAEPLGHKRGPKTDKVSSTESMKLGHDYLSRARTIVRYAPDLVAQVRDNILPLNEAYEVAKRTKESTGSIEALMSRLESGASDLAGLVRDGQLSINEAIAAMEKRRSDELLNRKAATANLRRVVDQIHPLDLAPDIFAERLFLKVTPNLWTSDGAPLSGETLRQCAAVLIATAEIIENGRLESWQAKEA